MMLMHCSTGPHFVAAHSVSDESMSSGRKLMHVHHAMAHKELLSSMHTHLDLKDSVREPSSSVDGKLASVSRQLQDARNANGAAQGTLTTLPKIPKHSNNTHHTLCLNSPFSGHLCCSAA